MTSKLYYAAGPGDVAGTFQQWLRGEEDRSNFAIAYSWQFFDLVKNRQIKARVVSTHDRPADLSDEGIHVTNRPRLSCHRSGAWGYWVDQIWSGLRLLADLAIYRPDVAVVAEGTAPWIFTLPASLLGIRIVPALHCVLWPLDREPTGLLRALDRVAFRFGIDHCLCVSEQVVSQVRELTHKSIECHRFYPSYQAERFEDFPAIDFASLPHRILYIGRIEADKGVFDLLSAFERLQRFYPNRFRLDFCGEGQAVQELANRIEKAGWGGLVAMHGHCGSAALRQHMASCQLVCVPTTSRFVEGFNKVIAEGLLCGRRVVATRICPAALEFGNAVTVISPDSAEELADALLAVSERRADAPVSTPEDRAKLLAKLLDGTQSWGAQLERCLDPAESKSSEKETIGYLVPQFPSQTHAFFWRELSAMRAAGAKVQILSTSVPKGAECQHDFAAAAKRETIYLSELKPAAFIRLLGNPLATVRAIRYTLGLKDTPLANRLRALALIPCAAQMCEWSKRLGIRHVHLHSCADAGHLGALSRLLGGPEYSLTLHGDLKIYGTDHRKKFAGARWVSAVTRPLHHQIVKNTGTPPEKVPVIWMGVDVERFTPGTRVSDKTSETPLRLATVARLIPQKGHLHALAAIARVRDEGIAVHYTIAGSGPFLEAIQDQITRLGLEEQVSLRGSISEGEVRLLLDQVDVFMLPSYGLGEAAPVSVMEAMACGLPVICSRIGGTEDMIDHLADGWLVRQQDEDELFEAITTLARDENLRRKIGNGARDRAIRHFDHRKNAARLLQCIQGDSRTVAAEVETTEAILSR